MTKMLALLAACVFTAPLAAAEEVYEPLEWPDVTCGIPGTPVSMDIDDEHLWFVTRNPDGTAPHYIFDAYSTSSSGFKKQSLNFDDIS